VKYKEIKTIICEPCLKGEGEMCDSHCCALFLHKVDIPIHEKVYEVVREFEDV
jgi:hypothetical protein